MSGAEMMAVEEARARVHALTVVHRAMNKRRRRLSARAETLLFAVGSVAVLGLMVWMALPHG